jgi:hypothetical protein
MPTYNMKNIETGEIKEMILSLTEREELLESGTYTQELSTAQFISMHGSTVGKTSGDWRDLLKKVHKEAGKGNTVKS